MWRTCLFQNRRTCSKELCDPSRGKDELFVFSVQTVVGNPYSACTAAWFDESVNLFIDGFVSLDELSGKSILPTEPASTVSLGKASFCPRKFFPLHVFR